MNKSFRNPNYAFWIDKKVLITGHNGFKGSWLSTWLGSMGAKVWGFSLDEETKLARDLENSSVLSRQLIGDIQQKEVLNRYIERCQPDIVFHLAAQPLVKVGYESPELTFGTNIQGLINLFTSLLRLKQPPLAILVVTSDKCYRNDDRDTLFTEDSPLGGLDPYSASKACAEIIAEAYHKSFFHGRGTKVATARAGNVIGGGDEAEARIVPDILKAITENDNINLRNPYSTRPWQHVLDPVCGYLLLVETMVSLGDEACGSFNFGPNKKNLVTVKELTEMILERFNTPINIKHVTSEFGHEAKSINLNIDRAISLLDWSPRLGLRRTCEEIYNFHQHSKLMESSISYCLEVIKNYSKDNLLKI